MSHELTLISLMVIQENTCFFGEIISIRVKSLIVTNIPTTCYKPYPIGYKANSQFIKSLATVFPFSQYIYESLSFDDDLTFISTNYLNFKISVLL